MHLLPPFSIHESVSIRQVSLRLLSIPAVQYESEHLGLKQTNSPHSSSLPEASSLIPLSGLALDA
jgi:hypothetical protein